MVIDTTQSLLGRGIYTPKQAARYARLNAKTLTRWIHGNRAGIPAVRAELADDPDQFVTFIDLVQAMAVRSIRLTQKVPLPLIREAVNIAESKYNLLHPFARRHTTYLFNDDIVIRINDDVLVQITGKYKDHQLIEPVVELYMQDLVYPDNKPLPVRYVAYKYNDKEIVLDPCIRFGEPYVSPCGYSVDELVVAAKTEASAEHAADAYGIDADDVNAALRFNDWLLGIAP